MYLSLPHFIDNFHSAASRKHCKALKPHQPIETRQDFHTHRFDMSAFYIDTTLLKLPQLFSFVFTTYAANMEERQHCRKENNYCRIRLYA